MVHLQHHTRHHQRHVEVNLVGLLGTRAHEPPLEATMSTMMSYPQQDSLRLQLIYPSRDTDLAFIRHILLR